MWLKEDNNFKTYVFVFVFVFDVVCVWLVFFCLVSFFVVTCENVRTGSSDLRYGCG